MPLSFTIVCDLFQSLENDIKRQTRLKKGSARIVNEWFASNEELLRQPEVDKVALLSTLLPERRTDRVFNIKEARLERIVAKACLLGQRKNELRRWAVEPASGVDLADCVETVLAAAPNPSGRDATVEDIDGTLHRLAASVPFSSPAVRASRQPQSLERGGDEHPLEVYFKRLTPRDAKWLCRLVLKNFLPIVIPEYLVYSSCHHLLPVVMKIHDNFEVAIRLLDQHRLTSQVSDSELDEADLPRIISPQVGVKVGRQTWLKARSIHHALGMGRGLMSCEAKMDGEYCQIHIDLSTSEKCIQIFSKSGKDSTMDRIKLHPAIRRSLGLGTPSCKFKKCCILEGEMVLWCDRRKRVLAFEKIRKHVSRSGRFIGTDEDSQPHSWERLMIMYFDVLLIDGESLLNAGHSERRSRLSKLIHRQEGCADLVRSQIINFTSRRMAAEELRTAFAKSISLKEEGLVLKPDEPYFSFGVPRRKHASCCLKLKKGYVKSLGDVGDFAVVGARYDPTRAKGLGLPETRYTHFYLGCLTNKEVVTRFGTKPRFVVVNEVEISKQMTEFFRRFVWERAASPEENDQFEIELTPGVLRGNKMTTVFLERPVFDVTCFSFHKESNTRFWSLRFPYVSKIHLDRSWEDCVSFEELQELAEADINRPDEADSQEMAKWIEALENADPKHSRRADAAMSQSTDRRSSMSNVQEAASHDNQAHTGNRAQSNGVCVPDPATTLLITPPTSSAVEQQSRSGQNLKETRRSPRASRKRSREDHMASSRPAKQKESVVDLTTAPNVASTASQNSSRQPLVDITSARSSQINVLSDPAPRHIGVDEHEEELEGPKKSNAAPRQTPLSHFRIATARLTIAKAHERMSLTSAAPNRHSRLRSICRYAGSSCVLANRLVLLSPCVASIPWLTEDLLPRHAAVAVFADIDSWRAAASLRSNASRRHAGVVLVERRRIQATRAFLSDLQTNPIMDRNGVPLQIIAYDWRLLEAVNEEEKARRKVDGQGRCQRRSNEARTQDLCNRYYVGLC